MRHLAVLDNKTLQDITAATDGKIYAVSVAKAIADCLPLPSSPVEDSCSSYFQEFIEPLAHNCISFFNSAKAFDVAECIACVQSFWIGRYRTLYPQMHRELMEGPQITADHFFGYGYHIPKSLLDYCKANAPALATMTNKAMKVVFTHRLINGC